MSSIRPIIITGPTACGKTMVAEILAKRFNSEIISADSRLVYRELDIGSAKYTISGDIKYHLVNVVNIGETFNLSDFLSLSRATTDLLLSNGIIPIIAGGTMLYIERYIKGFDPSPPPRSDYREDLRNLALNKGYKEVHNLLVEKDPELAKKIHPRNLNSVIRKLEKLEFDYISDHKGFSPLQGYQCFFLLNEKKKIYENIEKRLNQMIKRGWLEEVKQLKKKGYSEEDAGLDSIGYRHIFEYLNDNISFEHMFSSILSDTKKLARKQIKWRTRFPCNLINVKEKKANEVADEIMESLKLV